MMYNNSMSDLLKKIEAAEAYVNTPPAELAKRKDADLKFYRACCFISEDDDDSLDRYAKLFEDMTISCTRVSSMRPDKIEAENYYKMIVDCSYLDKVVMYVTRSSKLNYPYFVYPVISEFLPKQGFDLFKDEDEVFAMFRKNSIMDLMIETFELEGELGLNINKLRQVEGYDKAQEIISEYKKKRDEYLNSLVYTESDFESKIPFMV